MTLRLVWAALRFRGPRVAVAGLAVALGATLPAAMVGLQAVPGRFAQALETYGPNLLIVPRTGPTLDRSTLSVLARATRDGHLAGYAPFVALAARVDEREIGVLGTTLDDRGALAREEALDGSRTSASAVALVGARAAAALGLEPGDTVTLRTRHAAVTLRVTGVPETGGAEDEQVLVALDTARQLAGDGDAISFVQARVDSRRELAGVARMLEAAMPDAEVRSSLHVAAAESRVLGRLQRLLLLVTAAALTASILAVFAATAAAVLERRREVAVMKALGASGGWVAGLLAGESFLVGLLAGGAGFVLGSAMAEVIGRQVFGVPVGLRPLAVAASLTVALGVMLSASLGPIRGAVRQSPAAEFRGE